MSWSLGVLSNVMRKLICPKIRCRRPDLEVSTRGTGSRDEGKLGCGSSNWYQIQCLCRGPFREIFGMGVDVLLMDLILDKVFYSGVGYRRDCVLVPIYYPCCT